MVCFEDLELYQLVPMEAIFYDRYLYAQNLYKSNPTVFNKQLWEQREDEYLVLINRIENIRVD